MFISIYLSIYLSINESKYGFKSDSMKVAEKHNPNRWIYYDLKSTLTFRFHHQDLDITIVHIAMDAWWDDRSKWEIYNEKILKRPHSVHNSKVIRTCLARGNIFENVGFAKKRKKKTRQKLPFIRKYELIVKNVSISSYSVYSIYFSIYIDRFQVIHIKCRVRLYLVFVFFRYPSPDDGYWNGNVNVDFKSW